LPFTTEVTPTNLLTRVNNGEVTSAPPKTVPLGVVTVDDVAVAAEPAKVPGWLRRLLTRYPWLPWALIALGILLFVVLALAVSLVAGVIVLAVFVGLAVAALRLSAEEAPALTMEARDQ